MGRTTFGRIIMESTTAGRECPSISDIFVAISFGLEIPAFAGMTTLRNFERRIVSGVVAFPSLSKEVAAFPYLVIHKTKAFDPQMTQINAD